MADECHRLQFWVGTQGLVNIFAICLYCGWSYFDFSTLGLLKAMEALYGRPTAPAMVKPSPFNANRGQFYVFFL